MEKKSPIFLKANWTLNVFHLFDMITLQILSSQKHNNYVSLEIHKIKYSHIKSWYIFQTTF